MVDRDGLAIEDMVRHGTECVDLLAGLTEKEFLKDRVTQLAVERLLEIVGEAAGRLSAPLQARLDVDWRALRGLRNILAHPYGAVEPKRIWGVVRNRIPVLLKILQRAQR